MRATKEGVDGTRSRANVKTNDGAGGIVGVGEGGSGGAGIEEVLDPEEVVEAVWDLRFVSTTGRCGIEGGGTNCGTESVRWEGEFQTEIPF